MLIHPVLVLLVLLVSFAALIGHRSGYHIVSLYRAVEIACLLTFAYMAVILILDDWEFLDSWTVASMGAIGLGTTVFAWRRWRKAWQIPTESN